MLVDYEETIVSSVISFVKTFKLEEDFKHKYKVSIDDWEFDETDEDVIRGFLSSMRGYWAVTYDNSTDNFIIMKIHVP